MRFVRKQAFVREALTDHLSCVNHLTGANPHAGIARWDAPQAAEKMMKAALTTIGAQVPRTHELTRLAAALYENGLDAIDPTWIDTVQCEAGVRYGEIRSTISDAITAHHASLKISRHVAVAIRSAMADPDASWTGL
jgi:hypothetical protein